MASKSGTGDGVDGGHEPEAEMATATPDTLDAQHRLCTTWDAAHAYIQ